MPKKINHGPLALFPYTIQDGIPSMSNSYIMNLYDIMEAQHMLRWVFFSGGVANREEWLEFIKSRVNPFFCIVDYSDFSAIGGGPMPYGHILLTECRVKSAFIHFCWFRCNDKIEYTNKFFKEILEIMNYDVLFGRIPVTNLKINKFSAAVPGVTKICDIPLAAWDNHNQKSVDASLFYFLKGECDEKNNA